MSFVALFSCFVGDNARIGATSRASVLRSGSHKQVAREVGKSVGSGDGFRHARVEEKTRIGWSVFFVETALNGLAFFVRLQQDIFQVPLRRSKGLAEGRGWPAASLVLLFSTTVKDPVSGQDEPGSTHTRPHCTWSGVSPAPFFSTKGEGESAFAAPNLLNCGYRFSHARARGLGPGEARFQIRAATLG